MATEQQGALLWEPDEERIERATMTRYMGWLEQERGLSFDDYAGLWAWSTEELEDFWASLWTFFDVQADYDEVLADRSMPGAKWFTGAELSYPEHIFRDRPGDRVALRHASELRDPGEWTWDELRSQTARVRAGLKALGIERGDRIVAYMPNIPETIAAFLAVASLGAVWSSCSPDFGARSVVDRFAQIEPKVLLTVDGYRYGGKDHDRAELIEKVKGEMPSLERTVTLGYLDGEGGDWDDAFPETDEALEFDRVPFDHPLWVLYSSGTTGLPKAIVHSQGGILLEHLKKHHLHLDAQEGDRLFWFTTTGWMMWNFLVSALLTDAVTAATYPPCATSARPARRSRPRASSGSTSTWGRTRGCSPPAAAPTCARRSSAASRCSPSTAASSRAARSAPRSRPGTRTATRSSTRSASS
jgi:acetoacetyl-CoA synthetase